MENDGENRGKISKTLQLNALQLKARRTQVLEDEIKSTIIGSSFNKLACATSKNKTHKDVAV